MNEAEWLASGTPSQMLQAVRLRVRERKCRLFGIACCRRVWPWMEDERSRQAVEFAERHAEHGLKRRKGRTAVWENAHRALQEATAFFRSRTDPTEARESNIRVDVAHAAQRIVEPDARYSAAFASDAAAHAAAHALVGMDPELPLQENLDRFAAARQREYDHQIALLRDIFGHLFRAVTVRPEWREWNGGTIRKMAQQMYEGADFDGMPVLADALEEAGCDDTEILAHCRGPGPHVRGCWVVDLLLGKV